MQKLSVFIITKNEEQNLPRCLEVCADLADEIVVLDSGSTDNTQAIAEQFGATFSTQKFEGFGLQKYSAEQLCSHDWVLNLDADEFLTQKLKTEIRSFLASDKVEHVDGVRLKTVGVYPHHQKPRIFADYHNYIRLYNRNKIHYSLHPTQDVVLAEDESRIDQFKGIALHYAFDSLETLDAKARARTKFYFEQEKRGSRLKNILRLPFEFIFSFFKCYILRRQFTGGIYGIKNAYIYAKYRHIRMLQRVLGRCIL